MRISDWSSDVCSSDLGAIEIPGRRLQREVRRLKRQVGEERLAVAMLGADVLHQFVGVAIAGEIRSEERRGGKAWVSTCRSRWLPVPYKQKKISYQLKYNSHMQQTRETQRNITN